MRGLGTFWIFLLSWKYQFISNQISWPECLSAGNLPAKKGAMTKAKVVQPVAVSSRNKLKCCASNSRAKVKSVTRAVAPLNRMNLRKRRAMQLSFFGAMLKTIRQRLLFASIARFDGFRFCDLNLGWQITRSKYYC